MRTREKRKDRGRPAPDLRWRMLVHLDAEGLALIAIFFGAFLVLAILFLIATYHAQA